MKALNVGVAEVLGRIQAGDRHAASWATARQAHPSPETALTAFLGYLTDAGDWPALLEILQAAAATMPAGRWDDEALQGRLLQARDAGAPADLLVWCEALIAEMTHNLPVLLHAGTRLQRLRPDLAEGPLFVVRALTRNSRYDEAEPHAQELTRRFADDSRSWLAAADLAEAQGNVDAALAVFAHMRETFANLADGYVRPLELLKRRKRLEEAASLLKAALEARPQDRAVRVAAAKYFADIQDHELASEQWRAIAEMEPGNPQYALNAATALIGRPGGRDKRWPRVLAKLEAASARFPDHTGIHSALLSALRNVDRAEDAVRLAREWQNRHPGQIAIEIELAEALGDLGRWSEARRLLDEWRLREPGSARVVTALARSMSETGDGESADRLLAAALEKAPADFALHTCHGRLASRRGDFEESLRRWERARQFRPDDQRVERQINMLREQLGLPGLETKSSADSGLFAGFISLGGTLGGCEFGVAQRHFGSTDLGLLRWAQTKVEQLRAAFEREFEGVGEESNTVLSLRRRSIDDQEYVTSDRNFGMITHTFVQVEDMPADRMLTQTCRRLRFLKGKLLEDLRAGGKTFVFKIAHPTSDDEIRALFAALRRYGDSDLLCVFQADDARPPRTLRVVERGLFAGYLGYFMGNPNGGVGAIDLEGWKSLALQLAALPDSDRFADRLPAAA